MNLRSSATAWFVHHPVSTALLIAAVILMGVVAYPQLPIAPLPQVDYPTIAVSAALPGASADTMASAVATPLEVQLSSVPGITEMTSSSSLGSSSITLQFGLDKSIDTAALEVQSAINAAQGRLPKAMPSAPTWRKINPSDGPVLVFSVHSSLLTLPALSEATDTLLARPLSQLKGVGQVTINGERRPAVRVQASPERLAAYGLELADLRQGLLSTSVNEPKGALYGSSQMSTLDTNDQMFQPEQYRRLIIAYRNGRPIQLGDVAQVVDGSEDLYQASWQDGEMGFQLIIRRQPGANVVEVAQRVMAILPELEKALPASVHLNIVDDPTRTIRASLQDIGITLGITVVLVILVMSLFLRETAATLIVAAVLCVSLLATLAAMYVMGFSLNNLTLVALIIAVGFIVDDAIVVVENIHRHLEAGQSRLEAAIKGAGEIAFTVVTISVSLIAAFIPLLLMGGIIGRLFREFALTVAAGILVSVLTSLTLAPMLASRYMRATTERSHDDVPRRSGLADWLIARYATALDWVLGHQRLVLATFVATVLASVVGYILIPKGFFPEQDTGTVFGTTLASEDVSWGNMSAKQQAVARLVAADPAVEHYASKIGGGGGGGGNSLSQGQLIIMLKDRNKRDVSAAGFINRMRSKLASIPGMTVFLRAGQDINLSGFGGRAQYIYVMKSADSKLLYQWVPRLAAALQEKSGLRDVSSDLQLGARVTPIHIDRAAAARFGISADDVDQMLYDAFGQRQVVQYQTQTNQYYVVLEVDSGSRGSAETLNLLHFRSPLTGQMVPLGAVARVDPPVSGPVAINHIGMFPAVNVSFNLAPGTSLSQAVKIVQQTQEQLRMPSAITGVFLGNARAFQDSLVTMPLLILAALVAVYIILGILYESFIHPLTILSTLPSAGIGALLLLWLWGLDFSIMSLIGVVLLIGIVKKNGILMVDFALDMQRHSAVSPQQAAREACLVRFRPIMMTTIAAMLGAVPLMVGLGTGSELRQPLGISVFGGLLVSQALTLFTTPVIYLQLDRVFHRKYAATSTTAVGQLAS
jgi:HAE1 family hydrophobic/amphiphilic exporter-1